MMKNLHFQLNKYTFIKSILKNRTSLFSFNNSLKFCNLRMSRSFSEKVKLKDRIKLIDFDEMEIENEQWGELLVTSVEKENIARFYEQIDYIKQKKIMLKITEINKILQIVYNKYPKAVDILHDWIDDNNIQMDSITYHYLTMSALKFKGLNYAFNLLFRAHLFGTPQNLSIIINLCKEMNKMKNSNERMKYKNFLQIHVKRFYSNEVVKLLSSLNIDFEKDEEVLEDSGKLDEILKRNKKWKKNSEDKKISIDKDVNLNGNLISKKKTNSIKNSKENQTADASAKNNQENSQITKISTSNESNNELESQNTNNPSEGLRNSETKKDTAKDVENKNETETVNSVASDTNENKKAKKKSKEKRGRKNYENTLDNIFGNGGIIVIAQSLQGHDESDSSDSD